MNGKQVVNYHGVFGYGGRTCWLQGLYRSPMPETVAGNFRKFDADDRIVEPGVSSRRPD